MTTQYAKECAWPLKQAIERDYHDNEWGRPCFDDRYLFEFLVLEGAQAGLSWLTVLQKREAYRDAFLNYDLQRLAQMGEGDVLALMRNSGLIRHKGKIASVFNNARAALALIDAFGSLSKALWQFVDHQPQINHWQEPRQIPAMTEQSMAMSLFLKRQGFKFVGPTTCYAFMQAIGMVNDHLDSCPCKTLCNTLS